MNYPGGSVVNNLPVMPVKVVNAGSIPWSGRSPREGNDKPLQHSCLENPMDRGAWRATVQGVSMSWTQLNDLKITTKSFTHTRS